jgi:hypothetical protein
MGCLAKNGMANQQTLGFKQQNLGIERVDNMLVDVGELLKDR